MRGYTHTVYLAWSCRKSAVVGQSMAPQYECDQYRYKIQISSCSGRRIPRESTSSTAEGFYESRLKPVIDTDKGGLVVQVADNDTMNHGGGWWWWW